MNIFRVIRKALLQHRVYKYTLKYEDFSSKSERFHHLAECYEDQASKIPEYVYTDQNRKALEESMVAATQNFIESDHYKHLADIYLSKKLDLEEILQCYRKA